MSEITNIAFGNIANALKSMASDHILAIAEDIYDVGLKKYQSEINMSILTQDSAAGTYLPKAGGTMTGMITLGGQNSSSSELSTSQILFGTSGAKLTSNGNGNVIINPNSGTAGQIMLIPGSSPSIKVDGTTVSLSGHTHDELKYESDTRAVSTAPKDYARTFKFVGIKTGTAVGLTDMFVSLIGCKGYTDHTGPKSWEFATGNTRLYARSGTWEADTWNSWNTLAYLSDIPTSLPANGGNADTVDGKHASDFATADHTHNYAGSSSAGGAATSANKLNKITGSIPSTCASPGQTLTYYTLIGTTADENNKRYAGDNTGFPVSSNANSILWLGNHVHSSDSSKAGYGGQMGISSNGNLYYRFISNGTFPTTVNGGSWKQLAFTTLATTSASGLMSASDKTKLDGISSGAEVNVQSDWSVTDTTSDAYIKNKPTIPTIPSNNVTGSGTSGYLVKWSGENSVTSGPMIGSDTTTYLRNDGMWATPPDTTYSAATYNSLGLLKPAYTSINAVKLTTSSASNTNIPTIQAKTTISDRYYAVESDKNGVPYVNVPWTDTNTDTISIHKGTAEVNAVNQSVIPNVICSTLSTPTVGTRLQVKLSNGSSIITSNVANIIDFYLNNNTTTRYTITKNGSTTTINNVNMDGVLDLLFINDTSAELIYKSNISNNYVFYGACLTAAATQTKTLDVTEPGFELVPGTKLVVDFIHENTVSSPTLNVNNTGARSIKYGDGSNIGYMPAGPQLFVFYAENNDIAAGVWKCASTPTFIPSIYATCSNRPTTSAKTASVVDGFTGFRLFKGVIANVQFTSANTALSSLTLNVANTGAKPIYYLNTNYGSSDVQTNYLTWDANSIVQFVYSGTYWIAVNNVYIKGNSLD